MSRQQALLRNWLAKLWRAIGNRLATLAGNRCLRHAATANERWSDGDRRRLDGTAGGYFSL